MKGNRIQSIVRELNGENIDIINWSAQPEILISRSLAPSKPINMYIDEERPYVMAVFEDEDLAIAIGRNGQNIKLSSKITGYTIGGVSPVGHLKKVKIYVDINLDRFTSLFAAAGHPNCVFKIELNQLIKLTSSETKEITE